MARVTLGRTPARVDAKRFALAGIALAVLVLTVIPFPRECAG